MVVRSGTYTGTGAGQTIQVGDIGGQIDMVWIWEEPGNYSTISVYAGNGKSIPLTTDAALRTNDVTDIGVNQFTIGAGADVSQAGEYHWLAIRDDGADFAQGSYTGNGAASRAITGLGFQPDWVIIRADATAAGYDVRRDSIGGGSGRFDTATLTGRITSLDADGFTVDNTNLNDVNANGTVYYYAAFKIVAGKFKTAAYTGNGSDNRGITGVGFQPDFVIVQAVTTLTQASQKAVQSMRGMGDLSCLAGAGAAAANQIQAMQADGFQIGTGVRVNTNTETYHYWAFLAPAPIATSIPNKIYLKSQAVNRASTY